MKKKFLAITLGLTLALTLSACSSRKNKTTEDTKNNSAVITNKVEKNEKTGAVDKDNSKVASNNSIMKSLSDAKMTKEEAFDEFKKLHVDAKIESLKLKTEGTALFYEIDGYDAEKEYEITINAETKEVIKDEFETEKKQDNVSDLQKNLLSSVDGLIEKSVAEAGKGYAAKEYSVEYDDGKYVVEIEVEKDGTDISYKYDIASGELIQKDM
ncbi:MAG: PepSY domain-containing protein [Peptoniphilus sp.]|uniref:PepSY domain-containing protein n=1 Tax=Peptoniphilus sp. TaxID=1971214 RepID=UPI0025F25EDA|nr:PepSY domain-containing protein [Peptoniphilus sp.]MCI5642858.1 PepSY domain-containing protein [Peptoniphilus sp.]MDD7353192.1 PepSY domain-containing protein [Peptoniphilaceae bacterium]MDY3902955.1 PepSY domain-containing protein [Peptoniphilus sp.]